MPSRKFIASLLDEWEASGDVAHLRTVVTMRLQNFEPALFSQDDLTRLGGIFNALLVLASGATNINRSKLPKLARGMTSDVARTTLKQLLVAPHPGGEKRRPGDFDDVVNIKILSVCDEAKASGLPVETAYKKLADTVLPALARTYKIAGRGDPASWDVDNIGRRYRRLVSGRAGRPRARTKK